jgi:hypothetical protein
VLSSGQLLSFGSLTVSCASIVTHRIQLSILPVDLDLSDLVGRQNVLIEEPQKLRWHALWELQPRKLALLGTGSGLKQASHTHAQGSPTAQASVAPNLARTTHCDGGYRAAHTSQGEKRLRPLDGLCDSSQKVCVSSYSSSYGLAPLPAQRAAMEIAVIADWETPQRCISS